MFKDKNRPKPITSVKDIPGYKEQEFKLGDQVEKIAQPIAKAIDAVIGTNIQECGGCKKRKAALNKLTSKAHKFK